MAGRGAPGKVCAGRGFDHGKYRKQVRAAGIDGPVIARRPAHGTAHGSGLGTCRRVAGRSVALLPWFRRPRIRWEIRAGVHGAFPGLACAIICWRLRSLSLCPGLSAAFPVSPGAVQAWRGVLPAGPVFARPARAKRGLRYAWLFDIIFE